MILMMILRKPNNLDENTFEDRGADRREARQEARPWHVFSLNKSGQQPAE